MTFGSKLPPDLNPISSEEFRRARKADYDRKLQKRELERMAAGGGAGRTRGVPADLPRTIAWALGSGVAGFLGVAIGDTLALGPLVMLGTVLVAGVAVGASAHGDIRRSLGPWPPVALAIGAGSVGPVYLLLGEIPFLGEAWFVVAGVCAATAAIGYGAGGWLAERRRR